MVSEKTDVVSVFPMWYRNFSATCLSDTTSEIISNRVNKFIPVFLPAIFLIFFSDFGEILSFFQIFFYYSNYLKRKLLDKNKNSRVSRKHYFQMLQAWN
jgi:hypothetical protein